ncbi:MAG: ice-binding family protein [Candidatus Micrarchaeales archaeon]
MRNMYLGSIAFLVLFAAINAQSASGPVNLGTASTFGILSGSTVNFINPSTPTTVSGDLGATQVIPASGPSTLSGQMHIGDSTYSSAMAALGTAISDANSRSCTKTFAGIEIGGQTLEPGVYCVSGNAQITGTLILNGQGVYIFKVPGTLTTMSNSQIESTNGASSTQVFWSVGSSTSLGTDANFFGIILGEGAVSEGSSGTVIGAIMTESSVAISGIDSVTNPNGGSPSSGGTTTSTTSSSSTTTVSGSSGTGGITGGGSGSGSLISGTSTSSLALELCGIVDTIRTIIGLLALVMFLIGGLLYAIGHFMPSAGQVKASMQGWAMGLIFGGVIGVVLVILAPYIISVIINFGSGISQLQC